MYVTQWALVCSCSDLWDVNSDLYISLAFGSEATLNLASLSFFMAGSTRTSVSRSRFSLKCLPIIALLLVAAAEGSKKRLSVFAEGFFGISLLSIDAFEEDADDDDGSCLICVVDEEDSPSLADDVEVQFLLVDEEVFFL